MSTTLGSEAIDAVGFNIPSLVVATVIAAIRLFVLRYRQGALPSTR